MLSGCVKIDSRWLENTEDNKFEVISGREGQQRFVVVKNQLRTWNGKYLGGEEQYENRKNLLISLSEKESARVCGLEGYEKDENPMFVMKDTGGHTYGGGILGEILAHAFSQSANIPTEIRYRFSCNDEKELNELSERI